MKTRKLENSKTRKVSTIFSLFTLHSTLFTLCLLLVSCEEGPSGPNPAQEMSILYDDGIVKGLEYKKTADMQIHGDSVRPTFIVLQSNNFGPAYIDFFAKQQPDNFDVPELRLNFKSTLPQAPGTYPWEQATITAASGYSVRVVSGAVIVVDNVRYYPVSGSTIVTRVDKDGSGNVVHIEGWFNGKLRAQWPGGNASLPNPIPPDFDPANPTLIGPNLTVSSCVFFTRGT